MVHYILFPKLPFSRNVYSQNIPFAGMYLSQNIPFPNAPFLECLFPIISFSQNVRFLETSFSQNIPFTELIILLNIRKHYYYNNLE